MKDRNSKCDTLRLWQDIIPVSRVSGRASRVTGLSLVEVLIVVAILGILAAIAYPSYQSFVLRSHRANVQGEMQKIHGRQTLYNVEHRRYASLSELGYLADSVGLNSDGQIVAAGSGRYDLSLQADPPAGRFVIRASATNMQLADTDCTTLTLNTAGDRTAADCW